MAAQVEISNRGMMVREELEEYITKKASKLDRYIHGIQGVRVDLQHNKSARDAQDRFKAQITVSGSGYLLRAEERKDEIRAAFDSALSKMQTRISRYKGKRFQRKGDATSFAEAAAKEMEAELEEEATPEIVRRKKFLLNPMDEAEAIEQMRLLDHEDFFLFFNVDSNSMNVLYKRRDGNYGLIEGELG